MLKRETKRIGDHDYTVTQLDAVKGRGVMVRLAKLLAPVVGEGASGSGDMAKALGGLAAALTEEDLAHFCDTFAPVTEVSIEGKTPKLSSVFALHFAGKYDEMVEWLLFCVEVNFRSFFERAGLKRDSTAAEPKTGSK